MNGKRQVRYGEILTPWTELQRSLLFAGPGVLWIVFLLALPGLILLAYSFLSRGPFGQAQLPLTLNNYIRILGYGPLGWSGVYWQILWRSTVMAVGTTFCCILLAYPLAFFIAAHDERHRNTLLTLVVIPFWTNLVIRTYAWMLILGPNAWPAWIAAQIGLNPEQAALYPSDMAVYLGMVYTFLPYMVLPLYTAVERIDWTLIEAAQDLYANRWQVFWRVLLPQTLPGLASGLILVGIPAFGMFVVPDLLGGSKTIMIGNAIQQQFGASIDYPFGAALSFLVTGLTLGVLYAYSRYAGEKGLSELV
jgi:spermidine/putrescine transport system permease protein